MFGGFELLLKVNVFVILEISHSAFGVSFHPSLIILKRGNYKQWRYGIIKHLCWLHLLPHLYDIVPPLGTTSKKFTYNFKRGHVLGVITMHVDDDTFNATDHFECPHTLWTKIWEIYGDPSTQPFPDDLVSNYLVPVHFLEYIPYDYDTIRDFECLE